MILRSSSLLTNDEASALKELIGGSHVRVVAPNMLPGTYVAVETIAIEASDTLIVVKTLPKTLSMCGDEDDYYCFGVSRSEVAPPGTSFYFGSKRMIVNVQLVRQSIKKVSLGRDSGTFSIDTGLIMHFDDESALGICSTNVFVPELVIIPGIEIGTRGVVPDVVHSRSSTLEESWSTATELVELDVLLD